MADGDHLIEWKDLIGKDDTFKVLAANIKKIEKELIAMAKASRAAFANLDANDLAGMDKLEKTLKDIEKAQKKLTETKKTANAVRKKTIDLTNEELVQAQKVKIAQRERLARAKQQAIISKEQKNNIASLRAQLSLTTLDWKKLTAEEIKNNKVLDKLGTTAQDLVKKKKSLTKQLKKLEEATDDHRRSVGKYEKGLRGLRKTLLRLVVGRTIIDGFARMGNALVSLVDDFKDSDEEIKKVGNSLDRLRNGAQKFGLAFLRWISTPFVAFVDIAEKVSVALFGVGFGAEKASEGVRDLQNEFNAEIEVLRRGNLSTEARKQLISDINEKYKEYLPNLLDENATLEDITRAQNAANVAFEKHITLLASKEQFIDLTKRRLDALREEASLQRELLDATIAQTAAAASGNIVGKTGINQSQVAADVRVQGINNRIAANQKLIDIIKEEKDILNEVIKSEGINTADFLSREKTKTDAVKTGGKSRIDSEKKSIEDRLKAIEQLQRALEKAEVDNTEAKNERLIALENLRFKEEQRLREEAHESFKQDIGDNEEELNQVNDLNNALFEQQEIAHKQNLLDIDEAFQNKKFAEFDKAAARELAASDKLQKAIEAGAKKAQQDAIKELESETALFLRAQKEEEDEILKAKAKTDKKLEDSNKKLLENILDTQQKIGGLINDLFQKQVDLSKKSVNEQEENLARARDRAENGLKANLVFEEQELSRRQSEQKQRQQEAKNIAKVVALFQLTAAAAAGGDTNAVATALGQFGILTGFEALFGFEAGTENVEKSLGKGAAIRSGTDGYLGITKTGKALRFDGSERIVNASDNKALGGMSANDLVPNALLGSAVSDYFDTPNVLLSNSYHQQKEAFKQSVESTKTDNRVLDELKGIKKQLESQPNHSAHIVKVQKKMYEFVLEENRKSMKKIKREILGR